MRKRRLGIYQGLRRLVACVAACGMATLTSTPIAAQETTGGAVDRADSNAVASYVKLTNASWTRNAVLYQLNTRQFTPEGTFAAATDQLPRLKALGVDIIWLMPIHPIGEQNRKGSLGSPYSVRDYLGVNPEFGTEEDFRKFVDSAHDLGMYVILDWVANHSAWDNPLRTEHPDWYERDYKDDFRPTPWWDWSDIIDLDYGKPGVREYMLSALSYWVREFDIDGYRCDVAGFVPLDFWEQARRDLDAIKPVFMLAEWESRDLHARAFDATYAWSWYDAIRGVVQGEQGMGALFKYYSWRESAYPPAAMRMTYISNHDVNAWDHTPFEAFGDGLHAAIVLSYVGDGMPMIYNGQEAGNEKRLAFFEKDPIRWREHEIGELYRSLNRLKKAESALWNGAWGATMIRVWNTRPDDIFSFVREHDDSKVFAVFNFSAGEQTVRFSDAPFEGDYREYFSGADQVFDEETALTLKPWEYRVYLR